MRKNNDRNNYSCDMVLSSAGISNLSFYCNDKYTKRSNYFILLFFCLSQVTAEFTYSNFYQTLGLVFNGDATTADCNQKAELIRLNHTKQSPTTEVILSQHGEDGGMQTKIITQTVNKSKDTNKIENDAIFGHRDHFLQPPQNGCPRRLRLTSSHPSQVGSIWYEKRIPVLKGFNTTFQFQITDHSQTCSYRLDPSFSLKHHKSCVVHGGDGFAFVIHSDPNATSAIGRNGEDLGYGGMKNALAIEFDMWTNAGKKDSDDFFEDHISIHSGGNDVIESIGKQTALGYSRVADLADGKYHSVKVSYLPYLETKYFEGMTANENLIPYLKDNGAGRRLGTLAIFFDDGINDDKPILAIPLNLSVLLDLPQSVAYVGFTGSTGRKWEKHDIISWKWSEGIQISNS